MGLSIGDVVSCVDSESIYGDEEIVMTEKAIGRIVEGPRHQGEGYEDLLIIEWTQPENLKGVISGIPVSKVTPHF